MKCVILQPSYIPWRGYFEQIHKADVFVFYDDVQYDKRGWRNRNRIKTDRGTRWLTIPVLSKGTYQNRTPINKIKINQEQTWAKSHWGIVRQSYLKAPHFDRYADMLKAFYRQTPTYLSEFVIEFTIALAHKLGIADTDFVCSSELDVTGEKTDRLLAILERLGATHYISGPSARNYIEEEKFEAAGITLEYMNYAYPKYEQLHPPYDPQVSILDLLFMQGPNAPQYIWGNRLGERSRFSGRGKWVIAPQELSYVYRRSFMRHAARLPFSWKTD